ncbi:class I SAM-dependent methyltransferase [Leptospira langatensis]|uniref:Class I SAM-dependent methyltransferase n=1 Tax=Leptospira langatensis TaxID=2484983 RepID=A0A5F1ZYB5_9LEPT|nr:class I SAM-dependent methyltransferase [Leptospira langatensis]TGJ98327.1 class I SAM-dependent methyltransferase [Leptospira langatensis]TGL43240.1 class I SAM-dependent methyltransferase [Leptospira langatensis]
MSAEHPSKEAWETHYTRSKSKLSYPDENLVRMLSKIQPMSPSPKALDFGSGSGRHCVLLKDFGYEVSACDYSENSVHSIKESYPWAKVSLLQSPPYPFSDEEFDLIVSWGVLHYNSPDLAKSILNEKHRILKKDGYLAASVRAVGDTHLKAEQGKIGASDLKGGATWFYSQNDIQDLLSNFSSFEMGYTERTPLGKLEERICHWIFLARK